MLKVIFTKYFCPLKNKRDDQFHLDIEFEVANGITVLFGRSGCGKTSTLRAIAGLFVPDQGYIALGKTIFFDSQQSHNVPAHQRQVGYVFQNYALFPHLNVTDNIGFALNGWSRAQRRQRVEELIELLELQGVIHQPISRLSGGQAQRVAIARALAPYPKILLLDEPFTALDDQLKFRLRTYLKMIQSQMSLPIVLVTHSRSDAMDLADFLVTLSAGRVVAVGQASQLLDSRSYTLPSHFQWG